MLLKVYKLKFLLAMLLVPFLAVAQPTGWEVQTTPFQHFITVNSATLNAVGLPALEDGDYIGVFFDNGLTCGGYIEVNLAVSQSLNAYGESVFPMPTPGFGNGESFTWKFYDNSASEEYDFSPVMTGAQVWTLNGQSVLTTLNADFVIGSKMHPNSKVNYPLLRKIISIGYYCIIRILFNLPCHDTQTGLKLFKRKVMEDVFPRILVKQFAFDLEVLVNACHLGFKLAEAPIILESKRDYGRIGANSIFITFMDTMAIWYRMYILKYYDR